ncbi:MAG: hypothetical protein D6765_04285, partial [Bacteroidetes bacterium]
MKLTRLLACLLLLGFWHCNSRTTKVQRTDVSFLALCRAQPAEAVSELLQALQQVASARQWRLDTASSFNLLEEDTLQTYSALLVLDIEEDSLRIWHHADIERYARAGGAVLALDSAQVTPYLWPFFEGLLNDTLQPLEGVPPKLAGFEVGGWQG